MAGEPSVVLRPAAPGDVDRLLAMMRAFYVEDGTITYVPELLRPAVERLMGDDSLGRLWLIDAGRPSAGYLVVVWGYSLEFHGRDAFVDEVYLEPDCRNRGVGSRALALAEKACRAAGVRALHLEVERPNTRAQELYRHLGFRDHDRYLMTKMLVPAGGSP
jgi:ribosomal protein S18 acetylase RimI-like enzyme